jgi:hypothetical protein
MRRTAPLNPRRCIYIFSQQIHVLNILNLLHILHFFSSKCRLFHNANFFGSCIIHNLHTECANIKKNSGAKGLMERFNLLSFVLSSNVTYCRRFEKTYRKTFKNLGSREQWFFLLLLVSWRLTWCMWSDFVLKLSDVKWSELRWSSWGQNTMYISVTLHWGYLWYDIYIYIFNCNWVDTRWQQYSTHLHTNSTQNTENGTYMTIKKLNIHKNQKLN